MEFRLYDKLNCSFFDLIGQLEPHQTKSLGILFAKSTKALNSFLKLLNKTIKYDKYVVDCEPRSSTKKRFDILVRFYKNNRPLEALLIEAKSIKVHKASQQAISQLQNYENFNQLAGFSKQTRVTITRDVNINRIGKNAVIPITWIQLISTLNGAKDVMAYDYINYLTRIQGIMNYYDKEIQAIPAGSSLSAIESSGLYECPTTGKHYANQCKPLYLAFKNKNGGEMRALYKVKEIIEGIDLHDQSQIAVLQKIPQYANIAQQIQTYKTQTKYNPNDHNSKRLFILDIDNSIKLPNLVRPLENNFNRPYYDIKDFLQPVNSNINCVILQTLLQIAGNKLNININMSHKKIEICENNGSKQIFTQSSSYTLNPLSTYRIEIFRVNPGGKICDAELKHINGTWNIQFIF